MTYTAQSNLLVLSCHNLDTYGWSVHIMVQQECAQLEMHCTTSWLVKGHQHSDSTNKAATAAC
jgi:hypothetical protein